MRKSYDKNGRWIKWGDRVIVEIKCKSYKNSRFVTGIVSESPCLSASGLAIWNDVEEWVCIIKPDINDNIEILEEENV